MAQLYEVIPPATRYSKGPLKEMFLKSGIKFKANKFFMHANCKNYDEEKVESKDDTEEDSDESSEVESEEGRLDEEVVRSEEKQPPAKKMMKTVTKRGPKKVLCPGHPSLL